MPETSNLMRKETDPTEDAMQILWPIRLREIAEDLRARGQDNAARERDRLRSELWCILNLALRRYVGRHSRVLGAISMEDQEDLASEKSIRLLQDLEDGRWELGAHSGPQIASFLNSVARNGVVDLLRSPSCSASSRRSDPEDLDNEAETSIRPFRSQASPDSGPEVRGFVQALRACVEQLQTRERRIWFLRVFYDLSTREIAAHPEVGLRPSHVDVILLRVRHSIGKEMDRRGYRMRQLPPGAFVEVWKSFFSKEISSGEAVGV